MNKVIDNWLEFLKKENLSNIKLETGEIDTRSYINFNGDEDQKGIKISLNEINKEILNNKNDKFREMLKNGEDQNKLYLLFPILKLNIKNDKKNLEYLIPLFYIDITNKKMELFEKNEFKTNIFIKNEELKFISSSFLYLFNIDIKKIMKDNESLNELICKEFLKKDIIKDVFKNSFDEFKIFLKKSINKNFETTLTIDIENDAIIHNKINDSSFNENLIKELNILKNIDLKNSLFEKYINFESNIKEGEINLDLNSLNNEVWFGSFDPKYPLAKGQACVMQNKSNMIAVQGAPGTGKTTLFLSIVASKIVEKAFANINGDEFNNQILITSTSNKAVDNVVERFTTGDEFKGINDYYFIGGRKELMVKSIERVNNYINELKKKEFDEKRYDYLKNEITNIKGYFFYLQNDFLEVSNHFDMYLLSLYKKNNDLKYKNSNELMSGFKSYLIEYLDNPLNLLKNEEIDSIKIIFNNISKLIKINQEFSLLNYIEYLKDIKDNISLTIEKINKMPFYNFEFFGKPRQKLIDSCISFNKIKINQQLDVSNIDQFYLFLNKILSTLLKINCKSEVLKLSYKDIQEYEKYIKEKNNLLFLDEKLKKVNYLEDYNYNFGDFFRLKQVELNNRLYEHSLEFNRLTAIKNKNRVIDNLNYWINNVLGNEKLTNINLEYFFNDISLVYPIITSTLNSSNNFFQKFLYIYYNRNENKEIIVNKIDKMKPLNLILSDESGMTPVHSIAPLMYKSINTIIVGDPVQIEPVIALKNEDKNDYIEKFINDNDFNKYDSTKVTSYHRAAGCLTGNTFDIGDGIILDEHRRCQEDIAKMFVKVAKYKGMLIKTIKDKTKEQIEEELIQTNDEKKIISLKKDLKEAIAFEKYYNVNNIAINVLGKTEEQKNINKEEIIEIENVLKELEEAGYNLKTDVGIITPYETQEKALIIKFKDKLNHTFERASIGTVHKFQGVEFKVIIFSTVLTQSMNSNFINSKPNLINVAISRAKSKFILVGNLNKLINSGFYLKEMCEHIKETGIILEAKSTNFEIKEDGNKIEIINNNSIIKNYEKSEEILFTFDHINKFKELIENAKKSITIISPWINYSNKELKESIQYDIIEKAFKNGIEVKIISGYFGNDKDEDGNNKDLLLQYKNLLKNNLLFKIKDGNKILHTHEKILLIDNEILVIGSFNWLSHDYYKAFENSIKYKNNTFLVRRETSILTRNKEIIDIFNNDMNEYI